MYISVSDLVKSGLLHLYEHSTSSEGKMQREFRLTELDHELEVINSSKNHLVGREEPPYKIESPTFESTAEILHDQECALGV